MAEIEQEQATLRQNLLAKLAEVPPEAARVSGPREPNDVSHRIWERVKYKVGIDFEQPLLVSQWQDMQNFDKEFMPLAACTDTEA